MSKILLFLFLLTVGMMLALPAKSENLLTDPDLENWQSNTNLSYWDEYAPSHIVQESIYVNLGSFSANSTSNGDIIAQRFQNESTPYCDYFAYDICYPNLKIYDGKNLTFSVWINTSITAQLQMTISTLSSYHEYWSSSTANNRTWELVSVEGSVPSNEGTYELAFLVYTDSLATNTYIDNATLFCTPSCTVTTYDPSGYINNSAGNMVSGAKVTLSNATWNASTTSNISGYWHVNIYANGDYNYTVSKNEYITLSGNQTFTMGGTNYNFTLSCLGGINICTPPLYNNNGFNVVNYDMQFNRFNIVNVSNIVFQDNTSFTSGSASQIHSLNGSLHTGFLDWIRINNVLVDLAKNVTGILGLSSIPSLPDSKLDNGSYFLKNTTYNGDFPNSTVNSNNRLDTAINFLMDNKTNVISTGIKGDVEIPFNGTIMSARLFANETGSINVSVWRANYTNYPPTSSDMIGWISMSSSNKAQDIGLTNWSTSLNAGDILRYNVESIATIQRVTVSIVVRRS